jgi:hypothetical protein
MIDQPIDKGGVPKYKLLSVARLQCTAPLLANLVWNISISLSSCVEVSSHLNYLHLLELYTATATKKPIHNGNDGSSDEMPSIVPIAPSCEQGSWSGVPAASISSTAQSHAPSITSIRHRMTVPFLSICYLMTDDSAGLISIYADPPH